MAGRIGVVGSNMMDLVTFVERMPDAGETLAAPRFMTGHGGKGANQAVAAARLGSAVVMVSKVGDDAFGAAQRANFERHGIDAAHVTTAEGAASGVAPIFVEPSGENRILIVKGANDRLTPDDVDRAAGALKGCDLLLLQLEIPFETVRHTLAWGKANGVPTLLNTAPALPGLDPASVKDATFLVPNEGELALLTGLLVDGEDDAAKAASSLVEAGIETVIVTLGARGALVVDEAGARHVPAVRVEPVDTTGAGDAFIGSFAQHYVMGQGIEAAIGRAVRYAAHAITRPGTQASYADAAEFAAFCRELSGS